MLPLLFLLPASCRTMYYTDTGRMLPGKREREREREDRVQQVIVCDSRRGAKLWTICERASVRRKAEPNNTFKSIKSRLQSYIFRRKERERERESNEAGKSDGYREKCTKAQMLLMHTERTHTCTSRSWGPDLAGSACPLLPECSDCYSWST